MSTTALTVRDLFFAAGDDDAGAAIRLPDLSHALGAVVSGFEWQGLGQRVVDLLDVNVADILLGAWQKHAEVREQLRATAADPAKTALVSIGQHTIESSHAPSIEVRAQGRRLLELSFPIELAFDVSAVGLMVRGGSVCEIRAGTVTVRGTVKLQNTVILTRDSSPIAIPGRIVLAGTRAPEPAPGAAVAGV